MRYSAEGGDWQGRRLARVQADGNIDWQGRRQAGVQADVDADWQRHRRA